MSSIESSGTDAHTSCEILGSDDDKPPSSRLSVITLSPLHTPQTDPSQTESDLPVLPPPLALPARVSLVRTASGYPRQNSRTAAFRRRFFPLVTNKEWNDWRWQSRHRVRTLAQLDHMLVLGDDERQALEQGGSMLPVGITPYYMSLLDSHDPLQPLRRTVVPITGEFVRAEGEADDPLGEDGHSPVPGLVHRYPDRVLLLALDFCSTYCRYCTRSRVVGHGEIMPNEARLEAAFDYIRRTPAIRDVLISGGDPLALSEDRLDWILRRLREIPHLEFLRLGTKMPAVLPQRITPQLCRVLRRYHPFWMSVHFLHPDECTPEAAQACSRLADAGIPLGSQTVLLKGVNDDVETMKELVRRLLMMRVRPYYLYQCDPISGSSHFRTPVEKGLEIIEGLRGHTTGYAVPTLVIDAPGGGGKIPLQPNYVVGRDGDDLLLRNYEDRIYRYPDPLQREGGGRRAEGGSGPQTHPTSEAGLEEVQVRHMRVSSNGVGRRAQSATTGNGTSRRAGMPATSRNGVTRGAKPGGNGASEGAVGP